MGAPARRRAAALLLVLALVLGGPGRLGAPPAGAQDGTDDPSRAEVAALARDAVTDDEALAELRSIDSVDGTPVDLDAATADLGGDRAARLDALADALDGGAAGVPVPDGSGRDAGEARDAAQRVLDDQKFEERDVPRPFRGVLAWLADRLRPVGRFFDRLFAPILGLPYGEVVLAGLLVAIGAGLTALLIRRRSRAAVTGRGRSGLVDLSLDPADLDRRAEAAEASGDLASAVRLRYEAGLLRLVRSDRLVLRADTTATDAARQVAEPVLDALTADFEAVVYGGRPATAADVERARTGWPDLLGARAGRPSRGDR